MCKEWNDKIQNKRAIVPQKKKREYGNGKILRVIVAFAFPSCDVSFPDVDNPESTLLPHHPDSEYLEFDDDAASDEIKESKEPELLEFPPV